MHENHGFAFFSFENDEKVVYFQCHHSDPIFCYHITEHRRKTEHSFIRIGFVFDSMPYLPWWVQLACSIALKTSSLQETFAQVRERKKTHFFLFISLWQLRKQKLHEIDLHLRQSSISMQQSWLQLHKCCFGGLLTKHYAICWRTLFC